jgi:tetratricopeptide (TPR) repeat protein
LKELDKGNSEFQSGNLLAAEQYFIDAHEKAIDAISRDIASVSLLDSILYPQNRFSEAKMWIRSIVSNELRKAQKIYLKSVMEISVLERAPKNQNWNLVDLESPWSDTIDQQAHYDRLLKKLMKTVLTKEQRNIYSTWPGPGFTGFLQGIWNESSEIFLSIGIQRETVAMAAYDYLNYLIEEPLGSEETNPFNIDAPYRDEAETKILELTSQGDAWAMKELGLRFDRKGDLKEAELWWERGAALGNHACMRNLGVISLKRGDKERALDWYNKALAAGSKTVFQPISECYPKDSLEEKKWLLQGAACGDPVALNNLGNRFQLKNDFQIAALYYRRAAEFDPGYSANLSQMLCCIGLIDESRIWLERAIENKDSQAADIIANVEDLIKREDAKQQQFHKNRNGHNETFIELSENSKNQTALTLCKRIVSFMEEIDELNDDSNIILESLENEDNVEDLLAGAMIARGFIEGTILISEQTLVYLQATHDALSDIVGSENSDDNWEE